MKKCYQPCSNRDYTLKTTYNLTFISILSILSLSSLSCNQQPATDQTDVIAKVYDRVLTNSQLTKLISKKSHAKDSSRMADAYVEQWIRESLILKEAENTISQNDNIEQLVNNYRTCLLYTSPSPRDRG